MKFLAIDLMEAIGAEPVGELMGMPLFSCEQMPEGTMYAFSPDTEIEVDFDPSWWPGGEITGKIPPVS